MSYSDRIEDGNIFPHEDDLLVKHEGHIYLNLNNELYVPLKIEDDELIIDRGKTILGLKEEIEPFKNEMGDSGDIIVQYDIPDITELPEASIFEEAQEVQVVQDAPVSELLEEAPLIGEIQTFEDYTEAEDLPVDTEAEDLSIDDLLGLQEFEGFQDLEPAEPEDLEEVVLSSQFGTDNAVNLDTELMDQSELDAILSELLTDDIVVHDTGAVIRAIKATYSDTDINRITLLLPEHMELSNPLSLSKIQTLLHSMIQNQIELSKYSSLGEKIFYLKGLPEWLIPISCSRIDQDVALGGGIYQNTNADTGGCYINVDVPKILAPHADTMITDRPHEAPGKWNRARGEYAMNVIHHVNPSCDLASLSKASIHREMAPEYEIRITLSPAWAGKVKQKSESEKASTSASGRLKCGQAYAHAVSSPGGISSISVNRKGTEKELHVIGLLVRDIIHSRASPMQQSDYKNILRVRCKGLKKDSNKEFCAIIDGVMNKTLQANLTDEFFSMCHNMIPVNQFLRRFQMTIRDLDVAVVKHAQKIIHQSHPSITGPAWSKTHTDLMSKFKRRNPETRHVKRNALDYGNLYYCKSLQEYIEKNPSPAMPEFMSDPTVVGTVPVQPLSIQPLGSSVGYIHDNRLYSREDYKILQGNRYYNKRRDAIRKYPELDYVKEFCQLASLSYKHLEQCNKGKCLLGGLVIDIIQDIPEGAVIVQYMDALLENGDIPLYLEYLQEFINTGLINYDTYRGRYVATESSEIIMCICHKTYIEQQNEFIGNEEFIDGYKCKYCLTTLIAEEQISDFSHFTDRDIYAADTVDTDDDAFIGITTMFLVMMELLEDLMESRGWVLSNTDRSFILEQLENNQALNLNPYGKQYTNTEISDKTSNLRGFIQQQGPIPIIGKFPKTGLKIKPIKLSDKDFKIKNVISKYLRDNLPGAWPSSSTVEVLDIADPGIFPTNTKVSLQKSTMAIMSFYTLPILRLQAINISIMLSYITSVLELKYGSKEDIDNDVYAGIILNKLNTTFIHDAANLYSERMFSKYTSMVRMLDVMSREQKIKKPYFNAMSRLYNSKQGDLRCFNPEFTDYYKSLLSSGKRDFYSELTVVYTTELKDIRSDKKIIYERKESGQEISLRNNVTSLFYTQAPVEFLVPPGDKDNMEEYEQCLASSQQRVRGDYGYLIKLRERYSKAEDIAKEQVGQGEVKTIASILAAECGDNCAPPVLGHMAFYGSVAQGHNLMSDLPNTIPEDLKGYMAIEKTIEEYVLDDLPEPEDDICSFVPEGLKVQTLNSSERVYPFSRQGSIRVPITQGQNIVGTLRERDISDIYTTPGFIRKLENLANLNSVSNDYDVQGIFLDHRREYCYNILPEASRSVVAITYNEFRKKSIEMQKIDKFKDEPKIPVPSFMLPMEGEVLTPWGNVNVPDLMLRRVRRCQDIGRSLMQIIRWLGRTMTSDEMMAMSEQIKNSRTGNVIGANEEFKIEKDHIESEGYILPELYQLKVKVNDGDSEAARLSNYEPHNIHLYEISYDEYRKLVFQGNIRDETGKLLDEENTFLDLIYMCIKVDIIKHLEFIAQGVKSAEAPVRVKNIQYNEPQRKFIEIITEILNILSSNAGPAVLDPNRREIDKLYDLRFAEYANKRSMTTVKTASKDTQLNANSPYALDGEVMTDDGFAYIEGEDMYDPEADGPDADEPPEEETYDPDPDGWDLEEEMLDGMENEFQGEYAEED